MRLMRRESPGAWHIGTWGVDHETWGGLVVLISEMGQ